MSVLLGRPLDHAKVTFSFKRHMLPPLLGVAMMAMAFSALNLPFIRSKLSRPAAIPVVTEKPAATEPAPQPSPVASAVVPAPDNQPRIIIEKIGVTAPVVYDEPSTREDKFQKALQRGTVHYGNTALPGQTGNIAIFGHSSSYAWAKGDYKHVFSKLEKLAVGDIVKLHYEGTQYSYTVTGRKVVNPDALWVLDQTPNKQLSLIGCYPVGSDKQRLVVTAEQLP